MREFFIKYLSSDKFTLEITYIYKSLIILINIILNISPIGYLYTNNTQFWCTLRSLYSVYTVET
jgi:hypothetical protein